MARKRARATSSTRSRSLSSAVSSFAPTSDSYAQTDDTTVGAMDDGASGFIGPSYRVPKGQYELLKRHILSKQKKKKTTTKKKSSTRKRRSSSRGGYYHSGGGGLGPIMITGRGGYFADAWNAGKKALRRTIPRGTWSRFGTAVGGSLGGGYGAQLGSMAGDYVSKVTGFGDYTVHKNDLMQLDEGEPVPTFTDMGQGICIAHREYIGDISIPGTPATFTLTNFNINPGLVGTFPWLSQIAPNFDQYEILGMIFEFRSTSSDFGTTTSLAMGNVILATDYDSVDANYLSKIEMENSQYSTSTKPSISVVHAIECDPSLTPYPLKYVRTGSVPSGKDIRLYDHGNFQIATNGLPTGSSGNIGELWVSYKICFYKPQYNNFVNVRTDFYTGTSATTSSYWGANAVASANSSLGTTVTNNTLTFPSNVTAGQVFQVTVFITGTAATFAAPTFTLTGGTALLKSDAPNGVSATQVMTLYVFKATASAPTIVASGMTIPTSTSAYRVIVAQLDTDLAADVS